MIVFSGADPSPPYKSLTKRAPHASRHQTKYRKAGKKPAFLYFVAGEGLAPPIFRLCVPLRFSPRLSTFVPPLWSGLYLHPYPKFESWGLPSSLYTFPLPRAWLGIITLAKEDFTEFDRYSIHRYQYMSPYEPDEILLLHPAISLLAPANSFGIIPNFSPTLK